MALFGGPDVLRSTHQGSLIVCQVSASVLTQPTPTLPPAWPARADLTSGVVSDAVSAADLTGWHCRVARTAS